MNYATNLKTLIPLILLCVSVGCDVQEGSSFSTERSFMNHDNSLDGRSMNNIGSSQGSEPSKSDISVDSVLGRRVTCNSGGLLLERHGEEYIATITSDEVIEHFIEASQQTVESELSYSGTSRTVTVQTELP